MKMREKSKKVLAFLLTAIMVLSTNMSVLAASSEDFLLNTHAKFQTALDKYGDNAIFTSKLLGDEDGATLPNAPYEEATLINALRANYVVEVLDQTGTIKESYIDLDSAVAAALSGETIKILANTAGTTLTIEQDLTLDLNNFILTLDDIQINGSLIIEDGGNSGAIELMGEKESLVTVGNGGDLTINGGRIQAIMDQSGAVIRMEAGSSLTITGGNVSSSSSSIGTAILSDSQAGTNTLTITGGVISAGTSISTIGNGCTVDISGTPVIVGEIPADTSFANTGFITGGIYEKEVPEEWIAPGYKTEMVENGKYEVVSTFVASIGSTKYTTIQNAIDAAIPGNIIIILKDVEENSLIIQSDDTLILDLNGMNVTVKETPGIINKGLLTIRDSKNNGSLRTSNDTLIQLDGNTVQLIVENGTLEAGVKAISDEGSNNAQVTINNATILGTKAIYLYTSRTADLKINGGKIADIEMINGTIKIAGEPIIEIMNIYGDYTEIISGGLYGTSFPEAYLVSGYKIENTSDGKYKVVAIDYAASIGDIKYETIQAAIDAAGDSDTVKILKNTEVTTLEIPPNKTRTIDLNGKIIIATEAIGISNKGHLFIKDDLENGQITTASSDSNGALIKMGELYGNLTVTGGTLSSTGNACVIGTTGTYNNITIQGGKIQSNSADAILTNGTDTYLEISGGTIAGRIHITGTASAYFSQTPEIEEIYLDGVQLSGFIQGGTYHKPIEASWLRSGYKMETTTDGYYKVLPIEYVASIGNTQYETIQAAINAASTGDTISILKDCGETLTVTTGQNVILNLNDHTVNTIFTISGGDVTIKDSGTAGKLTTDTIYGDFITLNWGSLTVESGTLQPMYDSPSVVKITGGTLTINGGSVIGGGTNQKIGIAGDVGSSATKITITGGRLEGGISVKGNCTTSISGTPIIFGKISDSVFANDRFITGGTFDDSTFDKTWIANGYELQGPSEEGTYTVVKADNAAAIGEIQYVTIQEAINAASAGDTVTILKDITQSASLTVEAGKQVTIDLNGKIITTTAETGIVNKGNLTIKDSDISENGEIKPSSTSAKGTLIDLSEMNASITVDGGTLVGSNGDFTVIRAVGQSKNNITINGGKIHNANSSIVINSTDISLGITGGSIGGIRILGSGSAIITGTPEIDSIVVYDTGMNKFIYGGIYHTAPALGLIADDHVLVGTSDSSNTYATVLKNMADAVTPIINDTVSKYKGGTIYYPTIGDYTFAGWYSDSTCTTPLASSVISGDAYAKFVKKDSVINFLGGSLKKTYKTSDGNYDYTKTDLRFGYNLVIPAQTTLDTWGWNYKIGTGTANYRNGESKIDGYDGMTGYVSNLLVTGIPYTAYTTTISSQLTLNYLTADGTTVTVTEDNFNTRSVKDVADSIVKDMVAATDDDKKYAQGLLDSSAE